MDKRPERRTASHPCGARRTRLAVVPLLTVLVITSCTGGVNGTPGSSGTRDPLFPKLGSDGYDVQHYSLELDYDPASGHLKGGATIVARATKNLSAFALDFAGMDVEGATVDDEPAAVNRAGDELTLRPHRDLARGETFTAYVRYSGSPKTITDLDGSEEGWLKSPNGSVLALGEPTGSMAWFPSNNHPSDKATYDIKVTVPNGQQVVSNGELVSKLSKGGRSTFSWRVKEPMATYLATVAIGPYEIDDKGTTKSGIPIYNAVDPGVKKQTAGVVARLPEIIAWEELNFGPYPFSSTGVVVAPEKASGYALETQNRPVIPLDHFDLSTLVHELAHQWFGDSVTPAVWRDMWLNEGFAQYSEWLWAEDHGGLSAQQQFEEEYAKGDGDEIWAFPPAEPPTAAEVSARPVYVRGAMVVHKIREAVGDEKFYTLVQDWVRTHRHANASTEDFTRFVDEKAGHKLSAVWDTWLYGDGKPDSP
ncbi:M1 family metallopeptidase [Streptomyces violascens]|uniref:Aminopeptidase N n=1 Tax=Streptomyces violascens TaxID=67381 RepID=A0ABQ3QQC0_9ACTN|nr:M1 family metallopeptidase [Streptomyces violascens]GGU20363.1 metallopeptidase [Streptomyces violascens]GHI39471.1 metallopeptidase [Streptomyces violascens]